MSTYIVTDAACDLTRDYISRQKDLFSSRKTPSRACRPVRR